MMRKLPYSPAAARAALALAALCAAAPRAQEPVPVAPPSPAASGAATPSAAPGASGTKPAQDSAPAEARAQTLAPLGPPRYHTYEDVRLLVADWSQPRAGIDAHALDLGTSRGGLAIPAFEFGRAGAQPLEQRPLLLFVGALDGVSLAGCEAVLALASGLLSKPEALPADFAFACIPWGSPDALASALAQLRKGGGNDGRNALSLDDDGDGQRDEDGSDDLDGDGHILWMLVEDPRGPWMRGSDPRFLAPAAPGEAPRYQLVREGKDDDRDGRFNEDGPGGVVIERNFPIGWSPAATGAGTLPLQEPEARALANLALARRLVAYVLLEGNHGGIGMPSAAPLPARALELPLPRDRAAYQRVGALATRVFRRPDCAPRALWELRAGPAGTSAPAGGSSVDWIYASCGALAFEFAPWGPRLAPGNENPVGASFSSAGEPARELAGDPLAAWKRWLDDQRGGLGFVDWHPVELAGAGRAWVGGWEPMTIETPPAEGLAAALAGIDNFAFELARGVARLSIEIVRLERRGEIVELGARVRNDGQWPSSLAQGGGALLELELTEQSRLLAGERKVALEPVPGGGASDEVRWLFASPAGAPIALAASDRAALAGRRELRP